MCVTRGLKLLLSALSNRAILHSFGSIKRMHDSFLTSSIYSRSCTSCHFRKVARYKIIYPTPSHIMYYHRLGQTRPQQISHFPSNEVAPQSAWSNPSHQIQQSNCPLSKWSRLGVFGSRKYRADQRITYNTRFVDLIGKSYLSWYTSKMEYLAILNVCIYSRCQNVDVHLCDSITDGFGLGGNALQERLFSSKRKCDPLLNKLANYYRLLAQM